MPANKPLPSLSFAVAVLTTAACASSSGGPTASTCTSDLSPDARSLTDVVDSVGLSVALRELWDPSAGLTLAVITYDSTGSVDSTTVLSASLPAEAKDQLAAGIRQYSRVGQIAERVNLLIGDDAGPSLRRVREFRACPPEMLDREGLERVMEREAATLSLTGTSIVRLRALIGLDGRVEEVRIERGSSNVEVDAAAVRVMRSASFRPARVGGIPTRVWVNFPVTFRAVRRQNR